MEIFKPELAKRVDERTILKKELKDLLNQKYKLELRINEINKKLTENIPEELIVSEHAIERFKERVQEVPNKVAKKILSDPTLLERYLKHGEGRFKLKTHPNVLVVIKNFKIITTFNLFDAKMRLQLLDDYMKYWIDKRILKEIETEIFIPILTMREFKKNYYK